MASDRGRRHLPASPGREIVYCHRCRNEWYHDEHDLQCPTCHSDITEIITPENDPREEASFAGFGGPRGPGFEPDHDDDSDPDEEDIQDFTRQGPNGFYARRRIYHSPSPFGTADPGQDQGRRPIDPSDGDAILRRFTDMLMHDFNVGATGRSGPDTLFPLSEERLFGEPGRGFHRTTFTSPLSGGSASFTVTTIGPGAAGAGPMDFNTIFGNIMANTPPPAGPAGGDGNRAPGDGPRPPPSPFAASVHEILTSLLNPAAAVHGDAVYTQEALDRIITTLMEANPQSNAAPPASQTALDKLERKRLDDEMLGPEGKAECTICIDDLHRGDKVTVLPCKHWFHDECVVLWLKEHNTCPVCRHPIEGSPNRSSGNDLDERQRPQQSSSAPPQSDPATSMPNTSSSNPRRRDRIHRTQSENEDRLNSILRAGGVNGNRASPGSFAYRPGRSSISPPSPRAGQGSRTRERSPSLSNRRDRDWDRQSRDSQGSGLGSLRPRGYDWDQGSRDSQRLADGSSRESSNSANPRQAGGSSHGPLSWIRDQFRGTGNGRGGGGSR